jgi:hypothetical protein
MSTLDEDVFDDIYGSKYFGVTDLKDGEPRFKIGKVEVAELREKNGTTKRKYVMLFEGVEKGLVINKTNARKRQAVLEVDRPDRPALRRGHQFRQRCPGAPNAPAGNPCRT